MPTLVIWIPLAWQRSCRGIMIPTPPRYSTAIVVVGKVLPCPWVIVQSLIKQQLRYNNTWRQYMRSMAWGTSLCSVTIGSTSINNTIGRTLPGEFLIGSIGEIIIFARDLSNNEYKAVLDYLRKKWAI